MDIKIGHRVRLSPASEFYNKNASRDSSNPIHCLGIYVATLGGGTVLWDNDTKNDCYGTTNYKNSHLIFVDSSLKIHELWT